jgi:antitoxin component of MazEF toxin-antitoxin module
MVKRIVPIGNSYGLIIDKAILELLKITPDTELELSTDGTRLIVEPLDARRGRLTPSTPERRERRAPLRPTQPKRRYGFPKKEPW